MAIGSLKQNSLTFPWLLAQNKIPWLFPDHYFFPCFPCFPDPVGTLKWQHSILLQESMEDVTLECKYHFTATTALTITLIVHYYHSIVETIYIFAHFLNQLEISNYFYKFRNENHWCTYFKKDVVYTMVIMSNWWYSQMATCMYSWVYETKLINNQINAFHWQNLNYMCLLLIWQTQLTLLLQ